MDLLFGTGGDASSFALLFRSKPKASKQNNQQTEENAFALKYAGSEDDNHSLSTIGREYKDDDRVPLHTYLDLGLDGLIRETNFTREEIQRMYRGFKQECPRGLLDEETFLAILNMLFPGGDPTLYCSRIFNTFDRRKTGKLTFEDFVIGLSNCLHGDSEKKLQWAFRVYDNEEKGYLLEDELFNVLTYIYNLIGIKIQDDEKEKLMEHTSGLFELLDIDSDGRISEEEFVNGCLKNHDMVEALTDYQPPVTDFTLESDNDSVRSYCCHLTNGRVKRRQRSKSKLAQV
ncbi:frequenin-1-like isoform X2 [Clytia hemisphaerica]|uniref:frequenin-1-like isoform X2 n=1 Tax=Clytia hemisphaerica TaxID=252671 RepID=UPI0034D738CA